MVHRKTNERKTLKIKRSIACSRAIFFILLLIFLTTFTVIMVFFLTSPNTFIDETADEHENISTNGTCIKPDETTLRQKEKIDFQSIVNEWVNSTGGNKSVLIYDLDHDEQLAAYDTDEVYNTASLYKLFVVYEGYRRIQNGNWKSSDKAGNTGYTILKCLDLAIRESNSSCAETLWGKIGIKNLDEIIKNDLDIYNSNISELISTTNNISKIMKLFYYHPDIRDETLVNNMKDSFLNQPVTEYDWRQGLPSGFSSKVKVYNKVGWEYNTENSYWNIYNDAAIVEFPEQNRHFIVVVMTNKVSHKQIGELGKMIEEKFFSTY